MTNPIDPQTNVAGDDNEAADTAHTTADHANPGLILFSGAPAVSFDEILTLVDAETGAVLATFDGLTEAEEFTLVGDKVVFAATDDAQGRELRVLDLSAPVLDDNAITTLDLRPGTDSSLASFSDAEFTVVGNKVIFIGSTPESGTELQILDLSAPTLDADAVTTIDLTPGSSSSFPENVVVVGDKVVFAAAADDILNDEVQILDLSAPVLDASAVTTIELRSGTSGSSPDEFTVVGDKVVFVATDGDNGTELRVLDTNAPTLDESAVTTIVLEPGVFSSSPEDFTVVGDRVVFVANDDVNGAELRILDLSVTPLDENAVTTIDLFPGDGFFSPNDSNPSGFTVVGDKVVFAAEDETNGVELRILDLSAPVLDAGAVTTIDLFPGSGSRSPNSSSPFSFTAVGDKVFFSAEDDTNGRELQVLDLSAPTLDETAVATIDLRPGSSSSSPNDLKVVNGKLILDARFDTGVETIIFDPETQSVTPVTGLIKSPSSSPGEFTVVGDKVIFEATDDVNGTELRILDLAASPLDDDAVTTIDLFPGEGSFSVNDSNPSGFTVAGDKVVFRAFDDENGTELRILDLSAPTLDENAVTTIDLEPGSLGSSIEQLTVVGDKVVFVADDDANGNELRVLDLNAAPLDESAVTTIDLFTGGSFSPNDSDPTDLTVVGDKVVFVAEDDVNGAELRILDLAAPVIDETAVTTIDLFPGQSFGFANDSDPSEFTVVGERVVFAAEDGTNGVELRILDLAASPLDETAVTTIDLRPGESDSSPEEFTVVGNKVVFRATDDDNGTELRILDLSAPTLDETAVTTIDLRAGGSSALSSFSDAEFTVAGDKVVFTGTFDGIGSELAILDLSAPTLDASAVTTIDLRQGSLSSSPEDFIVVGDKVVFTGTFDGIGNELAVLDLSASPLDANAVTTIDLLPGSSSSAPGDFTVVGDRLVFTASLAGIGTELVILDLTASPLDASATTIIDLKPGFFSSFPDGFVVVGDQVIFEAADDISGSEVRVLDLSAPVLDETAITTINVNKPLSTFDDVLDAIGIPALGPRPTPGDDLLVGTDEGDEIDGLAGNDTLKGLAGDDLLEGSAGEDTVKGGDGNDTVRGGDDNDALFGDDGDDELEGGAGSDTLDGGDGSDVAVYGAPRDAFAVTSSFVDGQWIATVTDLSGSGDKDRLSSIETIRFDGQDFDIADFAIAAPVISPGPTPTNDDTPRVGGTAPPLSVVTVLVAGVVAASTTADANGDWSLDLPEQSDGTFELTATATDADGNVSAPSEPVELTIDTEPPGAPIVTSDSPVDDNTPLLTGTAEADATVTILVGGVEAGTTTADANGDWSFELPEQPDGTFEITATATDTAGNTSDPSAPFELTVDTDIISGTDRRDFLIGTGGDDRIAAGDGNDLVWAGRGDDSIEGGGGRDLIFGQDGDDRISGDAGADTIFGASGNDTVFGGDGRDLVFGGRGDDSILGDGDADIVFAGSGADFVDGGQGNDTLNGDRGADTIQGGDGDDWLRGGSDDDLLNGNDGNDWLDGGRGDDELLGEEGDDFLFGSSGDDLMSGGEGDDTLSGGLGADTLDGGAGNDELSGGRGNDSLTGGEGADTFTFSFNAGIDSLSDFSVAEDLLRFSGQGLDDLTIRDGQLNGISGAWIDHAFGQVFLEGLQASAIDGTDELFLF